MSTDAIITGDVSILQAAPYENVEPGSTTVREHIPARVVNIKPHSQGFECIFVEINLYKKIC